MFPWKLAHAGPLSDASIAVASLAWERESPQCALVGPWPWRGSMDGLETRNRTNAEPDTCLTRPAKTHCGLAFNSTSPCRPVPPVATGSSSRHDGRAAVGRGRVFRAFKACFLSDQGLRCMAGRPHAHEGVGAVGQILRPLSAVDRIKCLTGVDDGRDDAPAPQTTGHRFGDRVNPGGQPP